MFIQLMCVCVYDRWFELERGINRISWGAFVGVNEIPCIQVSCSHSRLYHSKAVEERILRNKTLSSIIHRMNYRVSRGFAKYEKEAINPIVSQKGSTRKIDMSNGINAHALVSKCPLPVITQRKFAVRLLNDMAQVSVV